MKMIFDQVNALKKKKHVTKADMCKFLANVPDVTLSMNCNATAEDIARNYSSDDIKELFKYWFGLYKSMQTDHEIIWREGKKDD